MPSPYYHGISDLGQGIADAIGEYHKRHQKVREAQGMLDMMANTADPSQPNSGKMLLDKKTYDSMSQYLQRHKDVGAAVVQERLNMMNALAMMGAKARIQTEQHQVTPIQYEGKPIGWTDSKGTQHFYPKHVLEMEGIEKPKPSEATKAMDKLLGKHGLQASDIQNLNNDSLRLLDSSGEVIKHARFGNDGRIYQKVATAGDKSKRYEKQWTQASSGQIGAKFVGTDTGDFRIPLNDWVKIKQGMSKMQTGEQQTGGGDVLSQAREAISQGADPDKVKARLEQMGVDSSQL